MESKYSIIKKFFKNLRNMVVNVKVDDNDNLYLDKTYQEIVDAMSSVGVVIRYPDGLVSQRVSAGLSDGTYEVYDAACDHQFTSQLADGLLVLDVILS